MQGPQSSLTAAKIRTGSLKGSRGEQREQGGEGKKEESEEKDSEEKKEEDGDREEEGKQSCDASPTSQNGCDGEEKEAGKEEDLEYLRLNYSRVSERRATNFTQVRST